MIGSIEYNAAMTNKEILPKFQSSDQIKDWVKTHPTENVADWIEQVLRENPQAYPGRLADTGAGALTTIVQPIVRNYDNIASEIKIWDGLIILTNNIQWDCLHADDVKYITNLLTVIGSLKVQSLSYLLEQLTDKKTLLQENLREEGPRLHVTALASLGAFGCNEQTVHIFERDIQEPTYAALSYRILWKFDRKYASQYADLMREIGSRNIHFPTEPLLKEAGQL